MAGNSIKTMNQFRILLFRSIPAARTHFINIGQLGQARSAHTCKYWLLLFLLLVLLLSYSSTPRCGHSLFTTERLISAAYEERESRCWIWPPPLLARTNRRSSKSFCYPIPSFCYSISSFCYPIPFFYHLISSFNISSFCKTNRPQVGHRPHKRKL